MITAAINTGMVENWAGNIADIGPIYPFATQNSGAEVVMFIIGLALWIAWHIWQTRNETKRHQEDIKRLK